jgi:hypothetical protein
MAEADNFRLVEIGGLAEVIEQVAEMRAWDELIAKATDGPHRTGGQEKFCGCHLCRPNRRYR